MKKKDHIPQSPSKVNMAYMTKIWPRRGWQTCVGASLADKCMYFFVFPHFLYPTAWKSDPTVEMIVATKAYEMEVRIMPPIKDIHVQIPGN